MITLLSAEERISLALADIGVIGAGPSGLSLAIFSNNPVTIYEKDDVPGGHARSFHEGPWTFDRGPHILFSRDKQILNWMIESLGDNVHTCIRNNKVIIDQSYIHYPIENDLGSLKSGLTSSCLISYVEAQLKQDSEIKNLDDWFRSNFGDALTDLYFKPYNEKIWKVPLNKLSMSWSERIPNPPIADVLKGALGVRTEGYLHQLNYQYPRNGGFQALADSWFTRVKASVKLGIEIHGISIKDEKVVLQTSNSIETHDWIVYTGYLDQLPRICNFEIPTEIQENIDSLRVNGISCVTIGVRGEDLNKFTALYVPDERFLFNRISFPHVFSPENAPEGHYLIQAEITTAPGESPASEDVMIKQLVEFCLEMGILDSPDQVVYRNNTFFSHAYVVYDEEYEIKVEKVIQFFLSKKIYLHGRFGSFQYINTDMCILESAKLAALINGSTDPYSCLKV